MRTHPLRLTPPQLQLLTWLRDGWTCQTAGRFQPQFRPLIRYVLHHVQESKPHYTTGQTLASLARWELIAWEPVTVTLAYDGRTVPGWQLCLTPVGQAATREPQRR